MLFYVFLSEGKHLLMFNVQLCLIFEFPLHSAIVTIVQKSSAYGYYSYKNNYAMFREQQLCYC